MKRLILLFLPCLIFAQVSANQYFAEIYTKYQSIQDLQANISLSIRGLKQTGVLSYKLPDKFIIKLDSNNQVFVSDGEVLTVYAPSLGTSFIQSLKEGESGGGLMQVLNSEYGVSYTNSPNLESLDESNPEKIIKLTFSRRLYKGAATINTFVIAFTPDGGIRRLTAYPTGGGHEIVIDIVSLKFNVGIPESRFKYEPPKSSNKVENFLYDVK